jgi:hypothetical protein
MNFFPFTLKLPIEFVVRISLSYFFFNVCFPHENAPITATYGNAIPCTVREIKSDTVYISFMVRNIKSIPSLNEKLMLLILCEWPL